MNRTELKGSVINPPINSVADGITSHKLEETDLQTDSTNYYKQRFRDRLNERWEDIFIAISVYLILCGVAFVAL